MTPEEFDRGFLWRYRAKLLRVVDGDTMIVLADTGFMGRHEVRIRLHDVWAPELKAEGGEAAKQRLTKVLLDAMRPENDGPRPEWYLRIVSLQKERVVAETTSFERFVADVFVVQENRLVNVADALRAREE